MLDVIDRGVPWMQFDRADLHQSKQPFNAIHPKPHAFAALASLNAQLMHALGRLVR